jgi:type IV pilus assembly protein PilC
MLQATSQVSKTSSTGAEKSTGQAPRIDFTSAPAHQSPEKNLVEKIRNFRVEFGPSRKDILHFTNQLAVMIRAGISLQDALEVIGQQCQNRKFSSIILDLRNQIEAGQSFSQALSAHSDVFGSLYINMVAAAEISGSLSDMLQKLAEYLDEEAATRSQIKGAMVYPIIIAVMAVGVTIFLPADYQKTVS